MGRAKQTRESFAGYTAVDEFYGRVDRCCDDSKEPSQTAGKYNMEGWKEEKEHPVYGMKLLGRSLYIPLPGRFRLGQQNPSF